MADYKRTRTVVKGDRSSVCRIERSSLLIIITALGWSAFAKSHFLRVKFDNEAPLFSLFKFFHCLYVTNIDCNSREMWNRRCFFFFSCPLPTNQPTTAQLQLINLILFWMGKKLINIYYRFDDQPPPPHLRVSTGLNGKASGHTTRHTPPDSPQQIDRSTMGQQQQQPRRRSRRGVAKLVIKWCDLIIRKTTKYSKYWRRRNFASIGHWRQLFTVSRSQDPTWLGHGCGCCKYSISHQLTCRAGPGII